MAYTITAKEYEEYRRLKSGIANTDWINEKEAMQLTGWSKKYLGDMRREKKISSRTINGRKHQFSRSNLNNLFKYS